MKKILALLALSLLVACSGTDTNENKDREKVNTQQEQYARVQPLPYYEFSLERDVAIQLYNIRNEARNTHTVVLSDFGNPIWDCPSIGYPIPYGVQLTNPETVQRYVLGTFAEHATVPQAEPNGLYSSPNTSATWIMCVAADGEVTPLYAEPLVQTFPFPVLVDYTTGRITQNGTPTVTINIRPGAQGTPPPSEAP